MSAASDGLSRCWWAGTDPAYLAYHDTEWGVPLRDDRALFELLCLEGAQAGLAWITILRKRDGYRRAFAGFDPVALSAFGPDDEARLLADPGIVRNRAKIRSVTANARALLAMADAGEPFGAWLWGHVDGHPIANSWRVPEEVPAETDVSRALSRALRARGFTFVGPTIVYAFMQSCGMVNDHLIGCFRHAEVGGMT